MRGAALLVVLSLLGACDGPGEGDAGPPDGDASLAFVTPTAPTPPTFTPCPAGWTAVDSGEGFEICEPPSGAACPANTERFVDSPDCVPVGDPCPAGEWAEPPAGATPVYVQAGATGGDGSMGAPYGVIQDAIRRAPAGAAVLLAKGTYGEAIELFGGQSVIGACAAETILAPSAGFVAVDASELNSQLANVTVRPTGMVAGVRVSGSLTMRGVLIENAGDEGVLVYRGGALDAEALVVRDSRTITPLLGRGISVADGTLTLARAIFERCPGTGIISGTGSTVTARAIIVRDSGQEVLGAPQLIAQGTNQSFEVRDSLLEGAPGTGLFANEDGSIVADQVVVREMRVMGGDGGTAGALARDRGRLELTRFRVDGVDRLGVAGVRDAVVTVEDSLITNVTAVDLEGVQTSLGVLHSGPEMVMRRVVVSRVDRVGVQVEDGVMTLEDVSIRHTGSVIDPMFTTSAYGHTDGSATLTRVDIEDARGAGILALRMDLTLDDVRIHEVAGAMEGRVGRGIDFVEGTGVFRRTLVSRTREVGIHAFRGANVTLDQVRILDTLGRDCQDTTCADAPGGLGIGNISAFVDARNFTIEGARLCGAMVALEGELDLRDGEIRGATVGACVQVDDYDLSRLTNDVAYADNGIAVDTTNHMIPPPADPLGSINF